MNGEPSTAIEPATGESALELEKQEPDTASRFAVFWMLAKELAESTRLDGVDGYSVEPAGLAELLSAVCSCERLIAS